MIRVTHMHAQMLDPATIHPRLIALVETALSVSGCSQRQLAAHAGINKDTLARSMKGERPFAVGEVLALLVAARLPPTGALLLALVADHEDFDRWLSSGAVSFLDTLLVSIPGALAVELGDNLADLKSKWGIGSARLVAKRLAEHVAEAEHRDAALSIPRSGA
jgi:antitoxin HigA-1